MHTLTRLSRPIYGHTQTMTQPRIEPGLVFDRFTKIEGVPGGNRAMNDRQAIQVMIEF